MIRRTASAIVLVLFGLFNRADKPTTVTLTWQELELSGAQRLRDLWLQLDLGQHANGFEATVPAQGCLLLRAWPAASSGSAK